MPDTTLKPTGQEIRCPGCDYILPVAAAGICPECGRRFTLVAVSGPCWPGKRTSIAIAAWGCVIGAAITVKTWYWFWWEYRSFADVDAIMRGRRSYSFLPFVWEEGTWDEWAGWIAGLLLLVFGCSVLWSLLGRTPVPWHDERRRRRVFVKAVAILTVSALAILLDVAALMFT